MSRRLAVLAESVLRCVPRQDGGFLIVTRKGRSAVSPTEIPEGARIVISDGQAVRAVQ